MSKSLFCNLLGAEDFKVCYTWWDKIPKDLSFKSLFADIITWVKMLAGKGVFAKCYITQSMRYAWVRRKPQKICLSNLYCGHYTTKFQFCQEFFEQKFDFFKINSWLCIYIVYRYIKHPTRFEASPCRAFLKLILMFPEKVKISLWNRKLTPPFDVHRFFIKIISLCALHR